MRRRAGFSLLEAIVVLAITSMLLLLIYSVGSRATQTGFRLGRRALAIADAQLGDDTTRALLQGMVAPVPAPQPAPDLDGTSSTLTASGSLTRSTPCGGPGPLGLVRLSLTRQGANTILACQTPSTSANLLDLGRVQAAFSYSLDGVTWGDVVHITGRTAAGAAATGASKAPPPRLLVRLATSDGRHQIAEMIPPAAPGARQESSQ